MKTAAVLCLALGLATAPRLGAQAAGSGAGDSGGMAQLAWVDRAGNVLGTIGEPQFLILDPAISPDGQRVATRSRQREGDLDQVWIHQGSASRRLTSSTGVSERHVIWSPDGRRLAYSGQERGGMSNLFVRAAEGDAESRPLVVTEGMHKWSPAWLPDQRTLVFHTHTPATDARDLMSVGVEGGVTELLVESPAREALPRVSLDGRFVAYGSDESGTWEVYVTTFPRSGQRWQITRGGGSWPRWGGSELFYWSGNTLMAVPVETASGFSPGAAKPLFTGAQVGMGEGPQEGFNPAYDVSRDGTRFVVVRNARQP